MWETRYGVCVLRSREPEPLPGTLSPGLSSSLNLRDGLLTIGGVNSVSAICSPLTNLALIGGCQFRFSNLKPFQCEGPQIP
jgi:hypothetical protein